VLPLTSAGVCNTWACAGSVSEESFPYTVFLGLAASLVALTVWSDRYPIT
jgi:hypothetical protein